MYWFGDRIFVYLAVDGLVEDVICTSLASLASLFVTVVVVVYIGEGLEEYRVVLDMLLAW